MLLGSGPKGTLYPPLSCGESPYGVWACSAPATKIGQRLSSRPVAAQGYRSEHGCPGEESVQRDTRACRHSPTGRPKRYVTGVLRVALVLAVAALDSLVVGSVVEGVSSLARKSAQVDLPSGEE